jgi:hypothetical protein
LTLVIPFFDLYILPYSGKIEQYSVFKQTVIALSEGRHLNKDGLIELVKLAYTLNLAKGSKRKRT